MGTYLETDRRMKKHHQGQVLKTVLRCINSVLGDLYSIFSKIHDLGKLWVLLKFIFVLRLMWIKNYEFEFGFEIRDHV